MRRAVALLVVAASVIAAPVFADTKDELDEAKARLGRIQAELDRATARYEAASSRLAQTRGRIQATRDEIARTRARIERIEGRLAERARAAYELGPASTLDLLLSSSSFAEFSDALEFLGHVAESDVSLVLDAEVARERLRRAREDLVALSEEQAEAVQSLREEQEVVEAKLAEAQKVVDRLTAKLREEQRAARTLSLLGIRFRPGGVLVTCPVAGPHSFVDSFGAPRSGGRTHQGTDLMAPYGTPVVAAQPGVVRQSSSALGGLSVYVYADNGDVTFYAHLSGYGATGRVAAGTVVGYVGTSGNAGGPHLHFEYHPGGGGAVNPYPYLLAVC